MVWRSSRARACVAIRPLVCAPIMKSMLWKIFRCREDAKCVSGGRTDENGIGKKSVDKNWAAKEVVVHRDASRFCFSFFFYSGGSSAFLWLGFGKSRSYQWVSLKPDWMATVWIPSAMPLSRQSRTQQRRSEKKSKTITMHRTHTLRATPRMESNSKTKRKRLLIGLLN